MVTWHCVKGVQIRGFFWSVFFRIWIESGDLLRKFTYLVQICKNTDQKKLRIRIFGFLDLLHNVFSAKLQIQTLALCTSGAYSHKSYKIDRSGFPFHVLIIKLPRL